jgi:tetratricopeptide (TPR) repeat protein
MTDPAKPSANPARLTPIQRTLALLLPLLFAGIIYLGLFSRYRFFGPRKITLTQEQSQRLSDQSKSLIAQHRYADALKPTLILSRAYPDNAIYLEQLAEIYDQVGRYDEEARYWEKYMNHAPVPIEACPHIGQAYWKQGDKGEVQAISAYQRCLNLDPRNPDSYFYLAHALEMSGQPAQAADQYQKGLAITPDYTDLRLGLARCWLRMNKADDAKKLAEQVLSKHPDSSGALLVLGLFDLQQQDFANAKTVLTRGSQLADTDPDFHLLLGRVAEQMNDNAEALRQYNRVLELRPSDAAAQSRRSALAPQSANK